MTRSVRRLFRTALLAALATGLAVLLSTSDAEAQPPKTTGKAQLKTGVPGGGALKKRVALEGVNEAPAWAVRVTVDRENRTYQADDLLSAEVVSEQPGYLYLFNIDAKGEIDLLFPNGGEQDNKIAAGTPVKVPGPSAGFQLRVTSKNAGVEYIKAVVSKEPLNELKGPITAARGTRQPITITQEQFSRALREAAFRGNKDTAPDTGNLTRDVDAWKRSGLKAGKVTVEQVNKQTGSWAEHQVEIYTAPKGAVTPPSGSGRRVALLVGISKFSSASIRPLGCAHKDAMDMAAALRGKFEVETLIDSQATLSGIRSAFSRLVENTRPGDTVLVYWAGHGGRCANTDGTEADGFDEYLVPHDGSLASDAEIKATMLMDKAFGRWIQELDGRKVMVILDTCHSGGQVQGMKAPRNAARDSFGVPQKARGVNTPGLNPVQRWTEKHMLSSELNRFRGLRTRDIRRSDAAVLCAAGPKEFAFEMQDGSNGVMTHFVLEFLQSNPSGVTLQKLADYVTPKVQSYVSQNFPGSPQSPVFADETQWAPIMLTP
jgi:hypothetical protein